MDPNLIAPSDWAKLWDSLHILWLLPFFAAGFALMVLLALAVVPSLQSTGDLPKRAGRIRALLVAVALVAMVGIVVVWARVADVREVLRVTYSRWWL